jgi:hypothetical protein
MRLGRKVQSRLACENGLHSATVLKHYAKGRLNAAGLPNGPAFEPESMPPGLRFERPPPVRTRTAAATTAQQAPPADRLGSGDVPFTPAGRCRHLGSTHPQRTNGKIWRSPRTSDRTGRMDHRHRGMPEGRGREAVTEAGGSIGMHVWGGVGGKHGGLAESGSRGRRRAGCRAEMARWWG